MHSCTNQEHCCASNIPRPDGEVQDNVWETATRTLQHWKLKTMEAQDTHCTISFHLSLTSHVLLLPGCHWCDPWTTAEKTTLPPFVWHPSFADGAQKKSHVVGFDSSVLCWEKRGRVYIYWNCCFPESKSEQSEGAELSQACQQRGLIWLWTAMPTVWGQSQQRSVLPLLSTVVCRIFRAAKVQRFKNWVLLNAWDCCLALAAVAAWQWSAPHSVLHSTGAPQAWREISEAA